MIINSFGNYLKIGKAKRKTPDIVEAKALIEQSKDRLNYIQPKEINQKTAKFIFQDAYEATREAAQSLMSIKGFKPYSHEATISFIKDFYSDNFSEVDIHKFNYFRDLRNNSIYKAVKVTEKEATSSIIFAKRMIQKIDILLKSQLK